MRFDCDHLARLVVAFPRAAHVKSVTQLPPSDRASRDRNRGPYRSLGWLPERCQQSPISAEVSVSGWERNSCLVKWNKRGRRQLLMSNATNYGGQMADEKKDFIDQRLQDLNNDGVDR